MYRLLSRIPVNMQKPIAFGVLWVAMILALFGVAGIADFTEKTKSSGHLFWKDTAERTLGERMPSLLGGLAAIALALLCVVAALRLITVQGGREEVPRHLDRLERMKVQQIADITNSSPSTVYRDIQRMIDSGLIDDVYIDYQAEQFVSKKYVPKSSHKTVVTCRACGANNELIVGITRACAACGEPLVLNTTYQSEPLA